MEQLRLLTHAPVAKEKDAPERRPVVAIPDQSTNTVLLYGDMIEVQRLAEALKSMDQVISTCHMKTWVVWVRGDKRTSFDLVANIVADSDDVLLASLGGGIFTSFLQVDKLQIALELACQSGQMEIVDQPYLQLVQAQESLITTGEEIAIPSTTSNQGVTETSVEFKTVGLSLAVTPWFLDQQRVRLAVMQENGVVGNYRKIDGVEIPEVFKQTLKTSVELRLGQTMVLGGVETAKREQGKGWLYKKDHRQVGHLYVVASVFETIPKAQVVSDLQPDFPLVPGTPSKSGQEFFDGNACLPSWNCPKKQVIPINPKSQK
ncbi:hypothetical protein HW115_01415 [Verrucomicrobiaceae bacterium N1E253]|uniref:Type II/III secretion system secretin-like domain-containing protein n=1 Tax=Oceaniferula marina TaxID=2748318 RepID=A0A851G9H2_9BACT|nr:type II and III secretion system protein [Oceaniferula marina]NWK54253.1 hypothetical protein [Oceaniferula marina]